MADTLGHCSNDGADGAKADGIDGAEAASVIFVFFDILLVPTGAGAGLFTTDSANA